MKLTDLKEDKKLQFFVAGELDGGFEVRSSEGHHHDIYPTREKADAAVDELNRKYNQDPHIK